MSIVQKPSALEEISGAADGVVPVGWPAGTTASDVGLADAGEQLQTAHETPRRDRKRVVRLGLAIGRLRQDGDAHHVEACGDEEAELKLELLLLREENARLKANRHRPPDLGTLIDQLRLIGDPAANADTDDDVWNALCQCLAVREALTQACRENDVAIGAIEARLRAAPRSTDDVATLSVPSIIQPSGDGAQATRAGFASAA